jgi:hypothetical protein
VAPRRQARANLEIPPTTDPAEARHSDQGRLDEAAAEAP